MRLFSICVRVYVCVCIYTYIRRALRYIMQHVASLQVRTRWQVEVKFKLPSQDDATERSYAAEVICVRSTILGRGTLD